MPDPWNTSLNTLSVVLSAGASACKICGSRTTRIALEDSMDRLDMAEKGVVRAARTDSVTTTGAKTHLAAPRVYPTITTNRRSSLEVSVLLDRRAALGSTWSAFLSCVIIRNASDAWLSDAHERALSHSRHAVCDTRCLRQRHMES